MAAVIFFVPHFVANIIKWLIVTKQSYFVSSKKNHFTINHLTNYLPSGMVAAGVVVVVGVCIWIVFAGTVETGAWCF